MTFEDFILIAYVVIDDRYHQFAPSEVISRRHVLDVKLSDPEIIIISICDELAGIDSENAWFSFVKRITTIFFQTFVVEAVLTEQDVRCSRQQSYFGRKGFLFFPYRSANIL